MSVDNGFVCNRIGAGHQLGTVTCSACSPDWSLVLVDESDSIDPPVVHIDQDRKKVYVYGNVAVTLKEPQELVIDSVPLT